MQLMRWMLAGLVIASLLALGACGGEPESAECGIEVTFRDRTYQAVTIQGTPLAVGEAIGSGVRKPCVDEPDTEPPEASSVNLARADDLSPEVAVVAPADSGYLYVASGRCAGFGPWEQYAACLRNVVSFDGREYVAVRLTPDLSPEPPETGGALAEGIAADGSPISMVSLAGIPSSRAIADAGDNRVLYVANGVCYEYEPQRLLGCLQA
jgi:hypothetical protein